MINPDPSLDPIRMAELEDFYANHKAKFLEIWRLTQREAHRSLFNALSTDDLALRLNDIIAPSRIRYSATAFKEKQKGWAASGLPTCRADSYFDAARQGIEAAQLAADNLNMFIASLLALDNRHASLVVEVIVRQAERSNIRSSADVLPELLQIIRRAEWTLRACQLGMMIATGQSMEKRKKGRPSSIYTPLAQELGLLWEDLTSEEVVTPRHQKKRPREELSQISTQFIWLAMQMAVPDLKLRQAETAIRNAIPLLRLWGSLTDPAKIKKVWRRHMRPSTLAMVEKLLGVEDNWAELGD